VTVLPPEPKGFGFLGDGGEAQSVASEKKHTPQAELAWFTVVDYDGI